MKTRTRRIVAWLVASSMILVQAQQVVQAATVIATSPLSNLTTSVVRPNIMYVLDNSGSMAWDYSPDYVNDSESPTAHTWGMCWGTSGTTTGTRQGGGNGTTCQTGNGGSPNDSNVSSCCNSADDMPWATPQVNYQTYDPTIRYLPPVHADGSSYPAAVATTAKTDGFSGSGSTNLTTSWPHQVWCSTSSAVPSVIDPTGGGKCVENLDTSNNRLYPDATHVFLKNYNGPPFFFVMSPSEYCTDDTLTNCIRSTFATSVGGVAFNTPALFRWCATFDPNTHTFGGCQAKRNPGHVIPNYLGGWVQNGSSGSYATASLRVKSVTSGESITGIKVGGTEVLGSTITAGSSDTVNSISRAACTAIQANSAGTGFTCTGTTVAASTLSVGDAGRIFVIATPGTTNWSLLGAAANTAGTVFTANGTTGAGTGTAQAYDAVTISAASIGTAANGKQVLVSGPPPVSAVNSTGTITVTNPPNAGYSISGISINGHNLILSTITADSSANNTAQMICNTINANTPNSNYTARTGGSAAAWGTCTATPSPVGLVELQRVLADSADNGQSIIITGPATGTQYRGTITVAPTTGQSRIDDITVGATSVLASKPLLYADGVQSDQVAADIATKINANTSNSHCTASVAFSVVTVVQDPAFPTSCTGSLQVTGTATAATGILQVGSTGNTIAATLGGIRVANSASVYTTIVGPLTATDLPNGSAVSANATTIVSKIGGGFSAAAPVATTPPNYLITVTAPVGSAYNGQSFTIDPGTSGGTSAVPPTWTFPITNATADNALINSISCGGTGVVTANTATTGTGTSSLIDHINNLAVNNSTNGLNLRSANGYSYACTTATSGNPKSTCTLTGPPGVAACAIPTFSTHNSITIANAAQSSPGSAGSPQWLFNITGATTDNKPINSITCGATNVIRTTSTSPASTVSTGSRNQPSTYISSLRNGSGATNGLTGSGTNGYTYANITGASGNSRRIQVTGPTGGDPAKPYCGASLSITNDSSITLKTVGGTTISGSLAPTSAGSAVTTPGTAPTYTITINNATQNNQSIQDLTCGGTNMWSGSATTGSGSGTNANQTRVNNLASSMTSKIAARNNGWSMSCTSAGNPPTTTPAVCTLSGPISSSAPPTTCSMTNKDNSITVNSSTSQTVSIALNSGTGTAPVGGSAPTWTFDITNATLDNTTIGPITCSGTNTLSANANTGIYDYLRINSLSGTLATNGVNSYSTSCSPPATQNSVTTTCTVTGPAGAAACSTLTINPDATITTSASTTATSTGGTSPSWTFDITGASLDNKNITDITCGGTSTFPTAFLPSSGTSASAQSYTRINNLTKATTTGLQSIGANGYGLSCGDATSTTPNATCTVTGPAGVAACTNLTFANDASISIGASTQTNPGAAATVSDDFAPSLATRATFSGGTSVQSTSTSGMASTAVGTIAASTSTISNGSGSSAVVPTNASGASPDVLVLSGGTDIVGANNWINVGIFKRTDIIPANDSYSRDINRSDCAGTTCTYTEELQNFANWYSYYRTRMLMMKSSSSLAFQQLTGDYRVGFDDICNCANGNCATSVKQGVAQFQDTGGEVSGQRTNWWNQLTTSTPSCSTPLRAETAKIGRYYGAKLTSATDPIQYSCQQNFMLLVTDGYWNESDSSNIKKLDGSDIGNIDNSLASAPRPYYDGQMASTSCPNVGSTRGSASSCRTLADVTQYYYNTDLRTAAFGNALNATTLVDVSANNVRTSPDDANTAQHMSFYAMGLGVSGNLDYRSDYATAGVGDYASIVSGTMNWPAVANLDPTGVDDLWHAAVNGHGKYFSAGNPTSVAAGLTEALHKISAQSGAAAAAATSNLEPVSGDNYAYLASYVTVDWVGDVQARLIDLGTGAISRDTKCGIAGSGCVWSAQAMLDNAVWSARNILIAPTSNASGDPLRSFTYNNLTATEQAYFNPSSLSQYANLHTADPLDTFINAPNLVNFLRGDKSLEIDGNVAHKQIWRKRVHILGDFVNSQPVFSKAPSRSYLDAGYSTFRTTGTAAARKPVVYISGNDGMLHAFNADNPDANHDGSVIVSGQTIPPGGEMWSYIPKQSLPGMKVLGDPAYAHRYFVDGRITIADVNFGNNELDWHTILIGGMGGGGTAYFALDVTDPLNPKYLWEFTDNNLGYTFGTVSVNKLADGTWAVFFSSGYNNTGAGANGQGYLYALNPKTGAVLGGSRGFPFTTGSGTTATPSNLGSVSAWVTDGSINNTAEYLYAGDLNGDVWRFDPDRQATGHTGVDVFKLAHLKDANGVAQPITARPELTKSTDGTHIVFVATGQYLGPPDLTTTQQQSLYAIKDTLGAPNLGGSSQATFDPRLDTITVSGTTVPAFLVRKLIEFDDNTPPGQITKTVGGVTSIARQICNGASSIVDHVTHLCANDSGPGMNWPTYGGWYVDLPDSGERVNVDMNLVLGTLIFASNVPSSNACTSGGSSWLNYLDFNTGLEVPNTDKYVSTQFANALIVGITTVKLPGGTLITEVNLNDNTQLTSAPNFKPAEFKGRRSLWREFEVW